jgi:hypothetical protein
MATIVEDPIIVDARRPTGAVSWGAILAGAAGAAALSMLLLILGTGLGMSAVSPWDFEGISAQTFGVSTIIWITVTQLLASGLGGYLAGRLRTKWADAEVDEIYFRDTAHGFLTWCVSSLAMAALSATVIGGITAAGVQAGANVAGQVASGATQAVSAAAPAAANTGAGGGAESAGDPLRYFVDSLFRSSGGGNAAAASSEAPAGEGAPADAVADRGDTRAEQVASSTPEVARIFANALRTGSLPDEDARYVGRLIADQTDLSQNEAEQRVRDTFNRVQTTIRETEEQAKQVADDARRATAYASLWLVVSLLVGAFVASLMATYGGRKRDL